MFDPTASFRHLRPATLVAVANFMANGGAPDDLYGRVASRAYAVAGNTDDAVALLLVAAEQAR